jgi:hypothetical protein
MVDHVQGTSGENAVLLALFAFTTNVPRLLKVYVLVHTITHVTTLALIHMMALICQYIAAAG